MTFIDSNVPTYPIGAPHPHKRDAQVLLERLSASGERLVTDAEVLQEILHRYAAICRRDAIAPPIEFMVAVADDVYPITKADVLRAGEIVQYPASFSARDALHLAVIERYGIESVLSFDADFDKGPGLKGMYRV